MTRLTDRHVKAWERFNAELEQYRTEFGEEFACLYEDANTTRQVRNFKMSKAGVLTWEEYELFTDKATNERETMTDEDDAREWLNFWRSCFRRAKRYNEMHPDTLDAIQNGETNDIDD